MSRMELFSLLQIDTIVFIETIVDVIANIVWPMCLQWIFIVAIVTNVATVAINFLWIF